MHSYLLFCHLYLFLFEDFFSCPLVLIVVTKSEWILKKTNREVFYCISSDNLIQEEINSCRKRGPPLMKSSNFSTFLLLLLQKCTLCFSFRQLSVFNYCMNCRKWTVFNFLGTQAKQVPLLL